MDFVFFLCLLPKIMASDAPSRSAHLPIKFKVRAVQNGDDGQALTLLAECSATWQTASFTMLPSLFRFIAPARGENAFRIPPGIPPLTDLRWTSQVFETAPLLQHFQFVSPIAICSPP
ncbi:hypothetical protein B0H14DRAFT_2925375 [Mycena olivaceomarginata]|nr:hypothetical protein B0H14DRAFT_2925375 [Mycena olivaceomarginata]